jgi:hypothetical protein
MDFHLIARNLKDKDSTITCPVENHQGPPIVPLVGNHTFHSFATILSGACGLASLFIILIAIFQHARHYSSPIQQRQIIRILCLVPWVCFFCFLIVWQIKAGRYLVFALDVGCAFALASFLLLMCDYVLSNENGFQELFGPGASKGDLFAPNSPVWLKVYNSSSSSHFPIGNLTRFSACLVCRPAIHPLLDYSLDCNRRNHCRRHLL